MNALATTSMGLALVVATLAALCDSRRGQIPNSLTLPPIVVAPFVYGLAFGLEYALHSLASAFLTGLVPYLLFRRGAMGGGDVKLFGALGAMTGFDLLIGIEIQMAALVVAMVAACGALAWKGALLRTLGNGFMQTLNPLVPARWRQQPCDALSAPVRMGGAIFAATGIFAAPYLVAAWSEW
ncbi:MAG: prepilin peptidase [Deltaproteobacteria bacterium]|jgi:prepilin peptidase CpaA|nr:prepilin peptidase [Deltaproteobacteria bacterium]MBW2158462.1 prepilin peptidase [Deltaproteobacteria bacterium]MBW2375291.1 prepilin peptidase [Deltaproteobacteria bacterium]MBW2585516.1 prepilin peptidase [Deltaproteobacteria bacterium]